MPEHLPKEHAVAGALLAGAPIVLAVIGTVTGIMGYLTSREALDNSHQETYTRNAIESDRLLDEAMDFLSAGQEATNTVSWHVDQGPDGGDSTLTSMPAQFEEARRRLDKAIRLDPKSSRCYRVRGVYLVAIGKMDEAVEAFRTAVQHDPDDAKAYNNMGSIFRAQSKLQESRDAFEQAVAMDPEFAAAHANLAVTLEALGEAEMAREAYREAVDLRPVEPTPYFNLGLLYIEEGNFKDGIDLLERALELEPDYPNAHEELQRAKDQLNRRQVGAGQIEG